MKLIQQITATTPNARSLGADQATDWISSYLPAEASTLATILSVSAAQETETSVLEAQLHAILELTSTGHVKAENITYLEEVSRESLPAELDEYLQDLLED
ncbi:hypothetical protein [Streptomyces sp. NPDC052225]|uniref:hypothetical protein n=1 Tax=Streptomyces sp. NPDC052225 TaxID=3154949 RepID=UPI00342B7C2A